MKIVKKIDNAAFTRTYYFSVGSNTDRLVEARLECSPGHSPVIYVSSQLGCVRNCDFCTVGLMPFVRDLTSSEIEEQVRLILEDNAYLEEDGFQIAYVDAGEPLENWINVFCSINTLRKEYASLKKICISTIWPQKAMEAYYTVNWNQYKGFLHLQYSLLFPNDEMRKCFLGSNISSIHDAIECLNAISKRLEDTYAVNYVLFDCKNDTTRSAFDLISIMRKTKNAILKVTQMAELHTSVLSASKKFWPFLELLLNDIDEIEIFKNVGIDVHAGHSQMYKAV